MARPGEAFRQAQDLLATQDADVTRYVADAFGFARGSREDLIDGEGELLRSLLDNDDPEVRRLVAEAAMAVAAKRPALAIDLLTRCASPTRPASRKASPRHSGHIACSRGLTCPKARPADPGTATRMLVHRLLQHHRSSG